MIDTFSKLFLQYYYRHNIWIRIGIYRCIIEWLAFILNFHRLLAGYCKFNTTKSYKAPSIQYTGMTKHRKQLVFAKTTTFWRKQVILAKLFIINVQNHMQLLKYCKRRPLTKFGFNLTKNVDFVTFFCISWKQHGERLKMWLKAFTSDLPFVAYSMTVNI